MVSFIVNYRSEDLFKVGLCSVTFRELSAEQVIEICKQSGVTGIEWGGDIHVPPTDEQNAERVAQLVEEAGLETVAYGSYYRAGYDENKHTFEENLSTAIKLKAASIRIWGGRLGSEEASQANRSKVAADIRRIADLSAKHQIKINIEYHARSLTDTPESAQRLMQEVNHPNVYLYWQPAVGETVENRMKSIEIIKPWLSHLHVFHWWDVDRLPLQTGLTEWEHYLSNVNPIDSVKYLLLEFVKDDSIEQFHEDVAALKTLVHSIDS